MIQDLSQKLGRRYHLIFPKRFGTLISGLYAPGVQVSARAHPATFPESTHQYSTIAPTEVKLTCAYRRQTIQKTKLLLNRREVVMRKLIIPITGTLLFIAVAVFMTPLRFAVFPQPLTRNERAILQRANAGLAALATKSPTAAGLYHEALASGRWSECITIIPTGTPEKPKQKAFSVTVMSSNPLGMMAFYLHPTKSVCFMEEKCESLGFLPLGLTYAHELRHRQDFEQGLVKVSDLPDSRPVNESEARCHLTEAVILNEYTNGRFNQAVENHAQAYAKKPRSFRYKQATDKVRLDIDIVWVKQEFGEQTIADRKQLLAPLLFMAAVRTQLPKHNATSQDSLDAAVIVLKK